MPIFPFGKILPTSSDSQLRLSFKILSTYTCVAVDIEQRIRWSLILSLEIWVGAAWTVGGPMKCRSSVQTVECLNDCEENQYGASVQYRTGNYIHYGYNLQWHSPIFDGEYVGWAPPICMANALNPIVLQLKLSLTGWC
jgi:hypothetical protein